jgi:hypothetical protein
VTNLPHIPKENHIFAPNLGTKTETDEQNHCYSKPERRCGKNHNQHELGCFLGCLGEESFAN